MQDPWLGKRLREYEILGAIGKGGMGAVYRARHVYLDELRAIKFIQPAHAGKEGFEERFIREARILAKLRNPYLVQLYEFGELEDGSFFMVQEFIQGESVLDRLRNRGRLSLQEAVKIVCEAASGLQAAHEKGIVHRDISPDNLLLVKDSSGREITKVIDFGIAKPIFEQSDFSTATNIFIGKPEYCSPEQCGALEEGEEIDGRSDIYSLGITFYHMITGTLPFHSTTPQGYILKHVTEAPRPPSLHVNPGELPRQVDQVMMKTLAKKRRNRYASMQELIAALTVLVKPEAATVTAQSSFTAQTPQSGMKADSQRIPPPAPEVKPPDMHAPRMSPPIAPQAARTSRSNARNVWITVGVMMFLGAIAVEIWLWHARADSRKEEILPRVENGTPPAGITSSRPTTQAPLHSQKPVTVEQETQERQTRAEPIPVPLAVPDRTLSQDRTQVAVEPHPPSLPSGNQETDRLLNLAESHFNGWNFKEAIEGYEQLSRVFPSSQHTKSMVIYSYYNQGLMEFRGAHCNTASDYFRQVLFIDESDQLAREALDLARRCSAAGNMSQEIRDTIMKLEFRGVPGFTAADMKVTSIIKNDDGYTATMVGPDNKEHYMKSGSRLNDGAVGAVYEDLLVLQLAGLQRNTYKMLDTGKATTTSPAEQKQSEGEDKSTKETGYYVMHDHGAAFSTCLGAIYFSAKGITFQTESGHGFSASPSQVEEVKKNRSCACSFHVKLKNGKNYNFVMGHDKDAFAGYDTSSVVDEINAALSRK